MGIKNNLTFVIVTYESDTVINDCLSSIPSNYPIIIIENSGKKNFQKEIEKKYPNPMSQEVCYARNNNPKNQCKNNRWGHDFCALFHIVLGM